MSRRVNNQKNNRGQLPSYWINIEEFANAIKGAYTGKHLESRGIKHVKGFQLDAKSGDNTIEWNPNKIVEVSSISFDIESHRNIGYDDRWNVYMGGVLVFDNIYVKEMEEKKILDPPIKLSDNEKLKIIYTNADSYNKQIWFDISYNIRGDS